MPYASQRDRKPELLELEQTEWPAPPLNLFVMSGYVPGVIDLRWSDPANLSLNSRFSLLGVNIYRSFDSEFGPYERITELPVGATFWRDQTDNVVVVDEEVDFQQWIIKGIQGSNDIRPRYVFRTQRAPLVLSGSQAIPTNLVDVSVKVDGVPVELLNVVGSTGEVEIDPTTYPNVATQTLDPSGAPSNTSVVTVTYRYNRTLIPTSLGQRIFYRVTSVGVPIAKAEEPVQPQNLVETALDYAAFTSNYEIEKLDYIWKEAVRRNRWILQEGGERVKLFLRKVAGQKCTCTVNPQYKQPLNDCLLCYGTGILGGYEGPYDIVIAPDDGERRVSQKPEGRTLEHTYEVWTGPSPLMSQRDFIVKINGDRYSVGAVRMPTNRGMVLQQHFSIGHLDEGEIRYKVPMDNLRGLQVGVPVPPNLAPAGITSKSNIPDERELQGRTKTWENITW